MGAALEELEREAARQRGVERRRARLPADEAWTAEGGRGAGAALRALGENVRDYAIFLLNPEGVITFWGEGAHLMTGWSKEEAVGAHLRLLYPAGGSDDGTAEDHLATAVHEGEYTGEGHRVRSDASRVMWARVTLTALRDDDGRLLGFAKVSRDLTTQRTTEAEIDAARVAAEVASRAKSEFLATMSHEIRTPLNAILGFLELMELEVGGPLTSVQRMFLDRAQASDRHLMELVDDVLDLSRLEADRLPVEDVVGNLDSTLEMTMALVEAPARSKRLALVVRHVDSHVDAGEHADVYYHGDEVRVRQILANLLTNSVKFTDPGGRITITTGEVARPPASVVASSVGPWAYVRVEDTGAGIAADRLAAVFEPFVQADMSRTRRHGGTGLGLAISRRLARLMGGDVTGESVPGKGSTFVLWLRSAPVPALLTQSSMSWALGGALRVAPSATLPRSDALATAAAAVLGDIRRVLHAHVARLRSDPLTPSARRIPARMLEDHLGTFLADLAESVASSEPRDDPLVAADRHGRQRARLGWTPDEVRREYQILGEELTEAVRRRVDATEADDAERAADALRAHLVLAERRSLAAFATSTPSSPYQ